ncbi:alpha,alpha-trehalose-phosphate synthase [UDP-forming] [Nilaparvata lugens]|uniref:alpha,alpha-trehalose-phosphate synthase [UDP-forming] n=1 Tax=Nilaparvata lugens TaxID=108931 RepID=UPI00193DE57C|nr:alpha,alpha-trehalose-phosphate synthase [UDP-forming] [Nilaparvata lugens]
MLKSNSRNYHLLKVRRKMDSIKDMSAPLIVVSNRLPFVLNRKENGQLERKQSAGGLVTAVAPVVIECKGLWIGWSGLHDIEPGTPIPEADPADKAPTSGLLSSQVRSTNNTLFPKIFKYSTRYSLFTLFTNSLYCQMNLHSSLIEFLLKAYLRVNEEFARCTIAALRKIVAELDAEGKDNVAPVIWIHDYQLFTVATSVRQAVEEENLRCKLGFFLHIPFPSWDIMRLFPWDDEILQGILACDFVGFHISDYCLNFIDCCCRRLGCRVDRNNMLVELAGRTVHVKPLPIGIPFDRFVRLAETAPVFIKDTDKVKVILGVDRLDYTKGNTIVFLNCINGKFSRPNWSPIRYIYGCLNQEQLAALYRDSAIALVTPLRDGMNLVAKEYVACQIKEPGVLILSPFAGAGEMMHEALLVNPYEINDAADVLHRALQMPLEERELRMTQLRNREQLLNVNYWMNSFLSSMGALVEDEESDPLTNKMLPLKLEDFDNYLINHIDDVCKLSLILDYDGTLATLTSHPDLAVMSQETRRVLARLSNMPDVNIAIISGRSLENVSNMVNIENVTYAGSHGLEILHPDGTKFIHPVPSENAENLRELMRLLQDEVCHDGAWVENKGVLLTFHYRETPAHLRDDIVRKASEIFVRAGFEPHKAHMAIEAKPPVKWDQGRASIHILRTMYGVDWSERVRIIYAGNEDAMLALQGIACTFRVDSSPTVKTAADFRLADPDSVLTMLKWIEKQMNKRAPRIVRSPRLNRSPKINKKNSQTLVHSQMSFEEEDDSKQTIRVRVNSIPVMARY